MIPLFFKSHYEVIAEMINQEHSKGNEAQKTAIETLAFKFTAYFAQDNANFKRDKFLEACGIGGR